MDHTVDLGKIKKETEEKTIVLKSEKKYLWIVTAILVVGSGTVLFWGNNPLLAILLIISSVALILCANKKSEVKKIVIDNYGIRVGENSFLYSELKSFWIDYKPGYEKELSLESKKWYFPYVKVTLEDMNPLEIRAHLVNFLPEKEHEKSLTDLISKKLGL